MNKNDIIIENVCGLLFSGAFYPVGVIKEQYLMIFEEPEDVKKIASILLAESKKTNAKVIRSNIEGAWAYTLSENYNFERGRRQRNTRKPGSCQMRYLRSVGG